MDLKTLFSEYKNSLGYFFERLDLSSVDAVFDLLFKCKGLIFLSGVGKSAAVAEKIAVTMASTGTRALFLPPLEAMHGDIGLMSDQDLFIALSKSGETDELLNLLPFVRNKGAKIIAFSSNATSRLAKAADVTILIPVEKELCPFNMAPTVSTTTQMIVGDVLAIALMQKKQFTLNEYAMNHPAGTIGKRMTLKVCDLMIRGSQLPLCHPNDKLIDKLVEISNKKAGCLLVVNEAMNLLGIFTDGDLRRALQKFGAEILQYPLKQLMTQGGKTILPEVLAWEAMKLMESNQNKPIMILPVVDIEKKLLGLLKMHDILQSGI